MTRLRLFLDLFTSGAFWRGVVEGMLVVSIITLLSIMVWIVVNV